MEKVCSLCIELCAAIDIGEINIIVSYTKYLLAMVFAI